jgi:four helix bundle protein
MQDFKNLDVWKKAHQLTMAVYKASVVFPQDELYGLTSQIRRAASSIPANIAEGCGRKGNAELSRYLQIAFGSASELEYHLILSHDLELLSDSMYQDLNDQVDEVKKMLTGLIRKTVN